MSKAEDVRGWVSFSAAMLPEVLAFIRDMFFRHRGSVTAAKAEIRRVRDHGRRFDEAQIGFEARVAAADKARAEALAAEGGAKPPEPE